MGLPNTVVRDGKKARHAAYPLMGGKEYETACGWRWKEWECEVLDEEHDCLNCETVLEVWKSGYA